MTLTHPLTQSLSQSSFYTQARAFWAITRKEWIIFRRYPSWVIALFIWPVIFPMAYILSGRALAGPDGSGLVQFLQITGSQDFIGYIAVGTTVWMWQNVVLWNVGFGLRNEQMRGTLESNWLSPTERFFHLLAGSLPQMFVMLVFITIASLEFTLFFGVRFHSNAWGALLVLLAAIPSVYGLGFAFASLVITAKEANTFVFLVRGLVMLFCGITFPVSLLPTWMQGIAQWLPPTYVIHAIRQTALNGATLAEILPDLQVLAFFGILWLFIGYLLFRWMDRRARQTGVIGHY